MFSSNTSQVSSSSASNYIEDVFSTYLYTGNSTTGGNQTITNGIDLSNKGGMVWIKGRNAAANNMLFDTVRGSGTSGAGNRGLSSNLTNGQGVTGTSDYLSLFNNNGFRVTQAGTTTATQSTNYNGVTYASWTFREQPKFFDIVTYTGTGANRTIAHNLGSVPGCIIIKRIDALTDWQVYHRSLANTEYMVLNTTAVAATGATRWNSTTPTSTVFSLGTDASVNTNGALYIAYIFAHNAGGFGLTDTDNVISCGSYTGNGSATGPTVSLGYEPQWLMIKRAVGGTGNWNIFDNMRGMTVGGNDAYLEANTADVEASADWVSPTATGFSITSTSSEVNTNTSTYIYIAIRRGPMKTPTSGTSVFSRVARSGTGADTTVSATNFDPDSIWVKARNTSASTVIASRLTGDLYGSTTSTSALLSNAIFFPSNPWDNMRTVDIGTTTEVNQSAVNYINYLFGRAPSFFDVVCYTGTGSNRTVAHNLGVVPQLMIVKSISNNANWPVYSEAVGNTKYLRLNDGGIAPTTSATHWNNTTPTASVFTVGTSSEVNASGWTYYAYLFGTCDGVSKVGSYTGTGATLQVDCGFTAGARFVLICRSDAAGSFYVWDSARGIIAGNDPYFRLDSTASEITNTDYVDTYSAGFEVSNAASNPVNTNGATYLFLAIA